MQRLDFSCLTSQSIATVTPLPVCALHSNNSIIINNNGSNSSNDSHSNNIDSNEILFGPPAPQRRRLNGSDNLGGNQQNTFANNPIFIAPDIHAYLITCEV